MDMDKHNNDRALLGSPTNRKGRSLWQNSAADPSLSSTPTSTFEHIAWAQGCEFCTFGLIDPPPVRGPLVIARRSQMLAGELQFCTCGAGQAYQACLGTVEIDMNAVVAQATAEAKGRKREQLFVNAGVPEKYQHYTFFNYVQAAAGDRGKIAAIDAIKTIYAKDEINRGGQRFKGLYLYGNTGVGKTGALSPLFVWMLREGKIGFWVQYHELLAQARDFESGKVEERIHALQRAEVVMIDDFGDPSASRMATDWSREVIFRIIDYRANHYLMTLVTSNLDPAGVENQFDGRTARRLFAICLPVLVAGEPMRETSVEF